MSSRREKGSVGGLGYDAEGMLRAWRYGEAKGGEGSRRVYRVGSCDGDPRMGGFEIGRNGTEIRNALAAWWLKPKVPLSRKLIRMIGQARLGGAVRTWVDCPWVDGMFPLFNERAMEVLGEHLEASGVVIPMQRVDGRRYFGYLCTQVVDLADMKRSKYDRGIMPGSIHFDSLVLKPKTIPQRGFFIFNRMEGATMAGEGLVEAVARSGLHGLSFNLMHPLREGCEISKAGGGADREHLKVLWGKGGVFRWKTVRVRFALPHPNKVATVRQMRVLDQYVKEIENAIHDVNSTEIPIGGSFGYAHCPGFSDLVGGALDVKAVLELVERVVEREPWAFAYKVMAVR